MKNKLIVVFVLLFFRITYGQAQLRFSQISSVPLLINPANTGRFDKLFRLGGSVRREGGAQKQDFTQSVFYLDTKILNSIIPDNDCFAIGFVGLSEKSNSEGINNTNLLGSLAYHKALDEDGSQFLGAAFQISLARKKIQKPNYIFESQILNWANFGYANIDIFQIGNVDVTYFDVNAGLTYQGYIGKEFFFVAGVSLYNIVSPKKIFPGGELNVQRQVYGYSSWEIQPQEGIIIRPAFLVGFKGGKFSSLLLGSNFQKNLNKSNSAIIGLWYKKNIANGHYLAPTLGLNFKAFSLITTYDIAISSNPNRLRNASELSITHNIAKRKFLTPQQRIVKF